MNHAMERMRKEHFKVLIGRHVVRRDRESDYSGDMAEASRRGRLLQCEPEKSLSDVPMHKRGFGVMDDDMA